MDDVTRDVLAEFMELFVRNWTGNPVETAMRVRALQELSSLETKALVRLASQTTGGLTPPKRKRH